MQRRDFIMALGLAAVWPLAVQAQQPKKVPRIGYLTTGSLELPETRVALNAFRQGLRELGYFDGQNTVIEVRAADSKIERFPALASERKLREAGPAADVKIFSARPTDKHQGSGVPNLPGTRRCVVT